MHIAERIKAAVSERAKFYADTYENQFLKPVLVEISAIEERLLAEFRDASVTDQSRQQLNEFIFNLRRLHQTRLYLEQRRAALHTASFTGF